MKGRAKSPPYCSEKCPPLLIGGSCNFTSKNVTKTPVFFFGRAAVQLVDLEASTGEIISFFGGDFFPIRQQLAEKEVKTETWMSMIISVTCYFETY